MESVVEQPCPVCSSDAGLTMIAHTSEIPYFGEHTQLTILCDACGWKHTDFIPAEGEKPGSSTMLVDSPEHMTVRVVRSASCTVRLVGLDLEAEPGGSATGYISNIEGVFNRFENAISMLHRQAMSEEDSGEAADECIALLNEISSIKSGQSSVELVLLDPMGRSQILHEDAVSRELSGEEMDVLSIGPSVPVFDADALP